MRPNAWTGRRPRSEGRLRRRNAPVVNLRASPTDRISADVLTDGRHEQPVIHAATPAAGFARRAVSDPRQEMVVDAHRRPGARSSRVCRGDHCGEHELAGGSRAHSSSPRGCFSRGACGAERESTSHRRSRLAHLGEARRQHDQHHADVRIGEPGLRGDRSNGTRPRHRARQRPLWFLAPGCRAARASRFAWIDRCSRGRPELAGPIGHQLVSTSPTNLGSGPPGAVRSA